MSATDSLKKKFVKSGKKWEEQGTTNMRAKLSLLATREKLVWFGLTGPGTWLFDAKNDKAKVDSALLFRRSPS